MWCWWRRSLRVEGEKSRRKERGREMEARREEGWEITGM